MSTFQDLLKELNACSEARKWAADRTIEQVVSECHRGDWLLWLAARVGVDNRKLVLAAGKCAETVIHLMKDERSKRAVTAAIDYGEDRIGKDELAAAARAAYAAAYAAAARAAYAADAAYAAARAENQRKTADIVREILGSEIIEKVNQKTKQ